MRKLWVFGAAFVLVASACGVGGQGGDERTVLVDFSHDEFASAMFANFPKEIAVPQGATVVFKQTWTGEPHTVTGGTLVDEMMSKGAPFMDLFTGFEQLAASEQGLPDPAEEPDLTVAEFFDAVEAADDEQAKEQLIAGYDALRDDIDLPARDDPDNAETKASVLDEKIGPASDEFFENLGIPWAIDENDEGAFITQNAGQPCYIDSGAPPEDADEPCPEADQRQPAFDGKATYYNSGMIPYEGSRGNTFEVEFADDIETGDYWFYCAVHGPGQSTKVKVVEPGEDVPSQEAISREARQEISEFSRPMLEAFRDARDGEIDMEGDTLDGPFAGLSVPVHGTINEFVPRTIETEVGEPVTWKIMGADHTITFDVPEYFPIMRFARNGKVTFNPRLQEPAGGSPPLPEDEEEGPPGTGPPVEIDGGTYDGSGFFSSGLFGGEPFASYTLRFSEPGTYKYACLLHPPMVGTVEVT
jgi:plastocyanin